MGSTPRRGLARIWVESTLHPRRFFREAPAGAGKALGYAAACVAAGGFFGFYWAVVFAAVSGPPEMPGPWGDAALPGALFLIAAVGAWLFSIPVSLLWLWVAAALTHVLLRLFGDGEAGLHATFRALAYSAGPAVFSVVPVVGAWMGALWGLGVAAVGLREMHRTDFVRAAAALVTVVSLSAALFVAVLWGELGVPGTGITRF